MTPQNRPGEPIDNIVTRVVKALRLKAGADAPQFSAVITGSICPNCFTHENDEAEPLIKPFEQFGDVAFGNRTTRSLNIPAIIAWQLIGLGVPSDAIIIDNTCTMCNENLYSYRRATLRGEDTTKRNVLLAVLRSPGRDF
jgi:copper oxidase (laccase) domain-containing protein